MLEAEIVTADGSVRIANACNNSDLFWALKGGGGGSFGVVTKLTLRTRELPENFGAVFGTIKANSDKDFKILIARIIDLYKDQLFNPHWGEQIRFTPGDTVEISMVSHGLTKEQAQASWQSFEQWVKEAPQSYTFKMPLTITLSLFPRSIYGMLPSLNKTLPILLQLMTAQMLRKETFIGCQTKMKRDNFCILITLHGCLLHCWKRIIKKTGRCIIFCKSTLECYASFQQGAGRCPCRGNSCR
ncbi:MAG: hypothetical protein WKG06_47745 [Segetibacter sp.]